MHGGSNGIAGEGVNFSATTLLWWSGMSDSRAIESSYRRNAQGPSEPSSEGAVVESVTVRHGRGPSLTRTSRTKRSCRWGDSGRRSEKGTGGCGAGRPLRQARTSLQGRCGIRLQFRTYSRGQDSRRCWQDRQVSVPAPAGTAPINVGAEPRGPTAQQSRLL